MTFTSIFSPQNNPSLLEAVNLGLEFPVRNFRPTSFRDHFIDLWSFRTGPRQRGTHCALEDVSFRAGRGERIGILGANGAGKSTLCRTLAGIYSPSSGSIVRGAPVRAQFDAWVGFHGELTGRENAGIFARLIYPTAPDAQAIATEALEFADLGKFNDVAFKYYSHGMQNRLGLSLATARSSEILILDEVFSGADQGFAERARARTEKMIREAGLAILVYHSMSLIESLCTRVLVLDRGKLAHDGSVEEGIRLYENLTQRLNHAVGQSHAARSET